MVLMTIMHVITSTSMSVAILDTLVIIAAMDMAIMAPMAIPAVNIT